jgi:hypothetical protein
MNGAFQEEYCSIFTHKIYNMYTDIQCYESILVLLMTPSSQSVLDKKSIPTMRLHSTSYVTIQSVSNCVCRTAPTAPCLQRYYRHSGSSPPIVGLSRSEFLSTVVQIYSGPRQVSDAVGIGLRGGGKSLTASTSSSSWKNVGFFRLWDKIDCLSVTPGDRKYCKGQGSHQDDNVWEWDELIGDARM